MSNRDPATPIRFVADMLVPLHAQDDFGETVKPTASLLTYSVAFRYSTLEHRLILIHEDLQPQRKSEARQNILFPHAASFRKSVVMSRRFGPAYISTRDEEDQPRIQLHGDGGSRGRPVAPGPSPRTIVGGTGSKEYPTIVAARREMASWHSVHLEPSSLRSPDPYGQTAPVDEHGRHIAATLRRLARDRSAAHAHNGTAMQDSLANVCAEAANQLAKLARGVDGVRVRDDDVRQHYVVEVRFVGSEMWMPPRALSDGTLRYLALVAMQMDARSSRVLCIEEPENGIEPSGVPALMQLLRDYAVDADLPVDPDGNPLRQVIMNSHSPEVVKQLAARDVLFVESIQGAGGRYARVRPVAFDDNWRPDADRVPAAYFKQWIGGLPQGQTSLA